MESDKGQLPNANVNHWRALLARLPRRARHQLQSLVDLSEAPPLFEHLVSTMEANDLRRGKGLTAGCLLDTGAVVEAVTDPAILSLAQAMRLAQAAIRSDPLFDARLLEGFGDSSPAGLLTASEGDLLRILDVIDGISDGKRLLFPLMKLTRHPSSRVRSKTVKMLGTLVQNQNWIEEVAGDPDPRVRSNLVESLSRPEAAASPLIVDTVLRRAAQDPHHRVAVTALLGLCRAGDQNSCQRLQELLNHPHRAWRAAARWALGRLNPDQKLPVSELQPEEGEASASPRHPGGVTVF